MNNDMKLKLLLTISLAMLTVAAVTRQTTGIHIVNTTDEIQLKINTSNQTTPLVVIATNGLTVFSLPATGILPAAYGGTGASSVSAAKTALGIQSGSITNADDGTVTNTFSTAFSSAPIVVASQRGLNTTTTNVLTVTSSNFIFQSGAPGKIINWIAVGAP